MGDNEPTGYGQQQSEWSGFFQDLLREGAKAGSSIWVMRQQAKTQAMLGTNGDLVEQGRELPTAQKAMQSAMPLLIVGGVALLAFVMLKD